MFAPRAAIFHVFGFCYAASNARDDIGAVVEFRPRHGVAKGVNLRQVGNVFIGSACVYRANAMMNGRLADMTRRRGPRLNGREGHRQFQGEADHGVTGFMVRRP